MPRRRAAGRRHRGRELALRVLFELESRDADPDEALTYQAADMGATDDVREFATELVHGTVRERVAVDAEISAAGSIWRPSEFGRVERSVLRLGCYELLYDPETPAPVCIDEAVELAKTYAGDEAGGFVNGVLREIARNIPARGEGDG